MNQLLIPPAVEAYATACTSAEETVLEQINQQTYQHHAQPHMLSGHVQGKVLEFFSMMQKPRNILEIGTFTGYSAICLAKGLQAGGQLHTIELREADGQLALENFHKAKMNNIITLHIGNALDIIPTLPLEWDMVFIDADKVNYIAYYEMILPRLQHGGIIIADNVLFHGQVLEEPVKGKSAKAIDQFNKHVCNDHRTEQVLLTVRDGLMLIKKK
ncbi:Predicted O-methyltransferase YrrM [Filimonas lacunae]|uniref:Predicted O-methyltransferase YrrM n=1 Tax=Filimonas lacunae TaxID=477680 RepID=A0A173MM82_9BACT|nr:O-methyltransferase [Filimonas lacunae]BAV08579.1 O-methyltransferase [Filimonas lacunae]SIS57560.1 Predicted O-methyltransferase YrrM [Filimonas lacunae]